MCVGHCPNVIKTQTGFAVMCHTGIREWNDTVNITELTILPLLDFQTNASHFNPLRKILGPVSASSPPEFVTFEIPSSYSHKQGNAFPSTTLSLASGRLHLLLIKCDNISKPYVVSFCVRQFSLCVSKNIIISDRGRN